MSQTVQAAVCYHGEARCVYCGVGMRAIEREYRRCSCGRFIGELQRQCRRCQGVPIPAQIAIDWEPEPIAA